MANPTKVIVFLALLGGLGVCYGQEAPKWRHVNVTFHYDSDEDVFLRQLKKEKVNFEEGKRIQEQGLFPVIHEFIVETNSIPKFEEVLKRLQLEKSKYSVAMEEYIKIGLSTRDTRLQEELKKAGIEIVKIRNGTYEWTTTYTVEVSLFQQVKDIANNLSICNYHYNRTRLRRLILLYRNEAAEAETAERLKRFHIPVEIGRLSGRDSRGKFFQEYYFESSLLHDFAYAIGITIMEDQ